MVREPEGFPTSAGDRQGLSNRLTCWKRKSGWPTNIVLNKIRFGRSVLLDRGAAEFVSLQHSQGRGVDVNRDEVLTADIGIAELVNVGNFRASQSTRAQFAM